MRSTTIRPALFAAGVLALAGCSSPTPTTAAPPAPTSSSATTSTAAPAPSTGTGPATGDSAPQSTSAAAGAASPCTASDVTASLGQPPAPGGQVTVALRYVDTGSRSCTLTGYPGATLLGPDVPQLGPQYQLPRSTASTPTTVTLAPGQAAVADLTLGTLPVGDPAGWQATELLTTAPDDTTTMTVPFPADLPVARQDAATRPATFVGPFTGPVS